MNQSKSLMVLFIYFSFSAFCGWIIESVYRSVNEKRFVNSGFLYGPFTPIYGLGALLILLIDQRIGWMFPLLRVLLYTLMAISIEYIISFGFERILGMKLWDYSREKFNLNGRICILFSAFWFCLIIFDLLFFQSFFIGVFRKIPAPLNHLLTALLLAYFTIDIFFSVKLYYYFAKLQKALKTLIESKIPFNPRRIFIDNPLLLKINYFFKPLRSFPNLATYIRGEWKLFTDQLMEQIRANDPQSKQKNTEFIDLVRDIIDHPEFQKLKLIHHHQHSIYGHSIAVAWHSYRIGRIFHLKIRDLARGALLHDFFLYNWRTEKPSSGKLHAFEHPKEAFANALRYFQPITPIEKDIITKHMWPLTIVPPKYIETLVVSFVDKIVASREIIIEMRENFRRKKLSQKH